MNRKYFLKLNLKKVAKKLCLYMHRVTGSWLNLGELVLFQTIVHPSIYSHSASTTHPGLGGGASTLKKDTQTSLSLISL